MGDWEDETLPPLLLKEEPRNQWDDEDTDEDGVKESWEDDDEPAPTPAPKPLAVKAPKKAAAEAADEGKSVHVEKEEPLDPVAEKLRQQRLVEEADYKLTAKLFAKKGLVMKCCRANLVDGCLQKSFHYIGLLKAVMRLSMTSLKASDAKELSSSVNAIANEKLKSEKEETKKKAGPKKKQLHMDKPDDDLVANTYDAADDYDFM
ncbi:hypothetical protein MLD38_033764 [Melastoma candidum]|uniref:Uncharacterized protein n=1 Tax=Melastoma candidum TaxID=119954 RepID=A0ACB9M951_9MYRT|nr:hypothetical protein MLD38_033764 [Melastoma candidum]